MRRLLLGVIAMSVVASAAARERIQVYAAGSLRPPLTEAVNAFGRTHPGAPPIALVFGASGLLRDRIAAGAPAQVFASANLQHPQALAARGGWTPARVFARNALCALARRSLGLATANLVDRLLDPSVRVGTSTPKADPSGDYAFEMFARIGARPGAPADARQRLEAKALQLTGGPDSPPPAGRSVYAALVAQGRADVFITYCTNALAAAAQEPGLVATPVPADIDVTADYGLTVREDAPAAAREFADWLLSREGQALLARHGFRPVQP